MTGSTMKIQQKTIAKPVTLIGTGLHSGKEVTLTLLPAEIGHGIIFERTDLLVETDLESNPQTNLQIDTESIDIKSIDTYKLDKNNKRHPRIPATAELITDTVMSSNLIKDGVKVGTVEHLLSAISAMEIDNLLIQVSDQEIPIMDGSAIAFTKLIEQAGITEQAGDRQFLKIIQPVKIVVNDKWVELLPQSKQQKTGFSMTFEINFEHPAIANTPQIAHFDFSKENFIKQISQARTFGFQKDIDYLRQNGLALGGSLENAIVVGDDGIVNDEGLRFADEFVSHKILDAVGDLYLIGYPLLGRYNAYKSGHELNNRLIRAVLADKNSYEIVTIDDDKMTDHYH